MNVFIIAKPPKAVLTSKLIFNDIKNHVQELKKSYLELVYNLQRNVVIYLKPWYFQKEK